MTCPQEDSHELPVLQDGVSCPKKAPWHPRVSRVTGLPMLPVVALAIYILAVNSLLFLALWVLLLVIFAWPLRYLICARCPYYGQPCSTNMGLLVTRMFKKQTGKSMKPGLWLDLLFLIMLFAIPVWPAWISGGAMLTTAWVAAYAIWMGVLTRMGCAACPFTFCPIGKIGRFVWRIKIN